MRSVWQRRLRTGLTAIMVPALAMGPAWAGHWRSHCRRTDCQPACVAVCCEPVVECATACMTVVSECDPCHACGTCDEGVAVAGVQAAPTITEAPDSDSVVAKPAAPVPSIEP